ncbi:unnamed protein product, partial [Anisakis simplex]|uniref:Protein downstream neighbor of Son (inferred by orthology to a human protein) n=1 Tax=Anisakis simplex TaxID=6269 RepID=A0A0M3JCR8_ANISI
QQQQQQSNIPGQNIANSREAVGTGAASVPIPTLQALGSVFVNAVAEQWTQAFEQLFHSWKKGARQNFYLCASQMTLLFLKIPPRETTTIAALPDVDDESTCSSWRISPSGETFRVIITPTTLGFREKLRNEGISYRMLSARRTATASGRLSRLVSSVATDEMVVHPPSSGRILARSESQPAHQAMASFHLDDRENSDLDKSSPSNFGDSIVTAEQEEGEGDENER